MVRKDSRKITRSVSIVLVSALSLATLAACGDKTNAETDANGKPIVRISVVHEGAQPKMKTQAWTKALTAACDCTIEWTDIDTTQWNTQKSPTLGGGNVPDVAINAFTPSDMAQFSSLFEDLAPQINKMANVKAMFDEYPDAKKMSSTLDGQIYTLPNVIPSGFNGSPTHLMINKNWLDKLGLEVPTTWDEFETVLKAFKTQDPNGNGKADEIPFTFPSLSTTNFGDNTPAVFLGSTGIVFQSRSDAVSKGLYVDNGKVKTWLTSDNFKRVATWLNKLMDEGLIPGETLTQDYSKWTSTLRGDVPTAGAALGWNQIALFDPKFVDQYVPIAPLKENADDPDPMWDYGANSLQVNTGKLSVSKKAANKDAIWKIVNALYASETSVQQYWGAIPEFTTKTGDNTYEVTQQNSTWANKIEYLSGGMAGWIRPEVKATGKDGTTTNIEEFQQADDVYKPTYEKIDKTKDFMPAYVTPDLTDQTTINNNNSALMNYATTQFSNWIKEGNVDGTWDAYVKKLESAGLSQNIELWQKWYDKYEAKY